MKFILILVIATHGHDGAALNRESAVAWVHTEAQCNKAGELISAQASEELNIDIKSISYRCIPDSDK